jgi:transcriptional regulator GlxA family with amidase domain
MGRQDSDASALPGWTKVTKNGPQLTSRKPLEIAIVCYRGSQATSIHGLTDLFTYADWYAREQSSSSGPVVRITHWRPGADAFECAFASHHGADRPPAVVIVPGAQTGPVGRGDVPECVAWIRRKHSEGAVVAAVCGGVFVLAESGLLSGRRTTTHWLFADELRRRYPELKVDADRLVIDDNDIVTAGGVLAWTDLGLSLVERFLGPAVMAATARFMLADPPGREQRFYNRFVPPLDHGDKPILAIQHWLQANVQVSVSVAELADQAALGERTFLRRFVKATRMKPTEYHQKLRITRSQELLELTRDTVDQIAMATGYEDPGGFRRTFKRVVGLSPSEYRRRFQR